ncbi:MAG TPA: sugar ABC transporter ATP-binding protein [Thermoleophilaceae bacterium]|nr:sugar ABC transporter ATP-binding protein [Thermoleophilaceae bacterium]
MEPGTLDLRRAMHDYSGVVVLRDVDFAIRPGEVHGLVGQNGSGKSTLIKILTGAVKPTRGTISLDGDEVEFASPEDAQGIGVGVVHQDDQLFPDLTVAECVFGVNKRPPRRRFTRAIDRRRVDERVAAALDALGIEIPPTRLVRLLAPAERKFVEIARATILEPRFLILDEATAAFEPSAARAVLDLLDRLRAGGLGICFVSHRLDEVLRVSDRITVLRDGRVAGNLDRETAGEERLVGMLVGGERDRASSRSVGPAEDVALKICSARVAPGRPPVDLALRRGEILGCVGLIGSGAATLVRMLGGAEPLRGWVENEDGPARIRSPKDAGRLGIGFIPEDRKGAGVVGDLSVAANMALASLPQLRGRFGRLNTRKVAAMAENYRGAMDIRLPSIYAPVRTLSGGNQQKVMLARWLASGVRILAVEEPTHGVDVKGKLQIHNLLRGLAEDGGTVMVASTDTREVLDLCDRIVVFRHGAVTDVIDAGELSSADDGEQVLERLIGSGTTAQAAGA